VFAGSPWEFPNLVLEVERPASRASIRIPIESAPCSPLPNI
jgi:hypothetical protein